MKYTTGMATAVLALGLSGGCRAMTAEPTKVITLVKAPHCEAGAMLAKPLAVYAESGSMKFFGSHTGTTPETTVTIKGGVHEITLKFGACPNPASTSAYSCAPHDHDGVGYYADRKITVDPDKPDTPHADFVAPTTPMLCTDGKPATI